MEAKDLVVGVIATTLVFGAYFVGVFEGQRNTRAWREWFASITRQLRLKGFFWVAAVPIGWLLLFYGFVLCVWLALGHWPAFGQPLSGWPLLLSEKVIRYVAWGLICSLWATPLIFAGCLLLPRWRHVSIYAIAYAAAVGVAFGLMLLAPHPFLNWFFD